jgi:CheY-like chemotaxis protein
MEGSILNGRRVLTVDDEPDVLNLLEEEILAACPDSKVDKATTYQEAVERMMSLTYDVVILDIMGVRGFDLLELAVSRNFPVAMLTAHALTPEALKRAFEMKAHAYLPKEKLGEIVPFLEDVLHYEYLPGWKRLLEKLKGSFDNKFEKDWEKKVGMDWRQWE